MPATIRLVETDGTQSWITYRTARNLIKSGLAVGGRGVVRELPRIRAMGARFASTSRSARYLHGSGRGLKLYREELRDTLRRSAQGKLANTESEEYVAMQREEQRVSLPHGWGRP